jgi:alpha-L-fucosidase 2
MRAAGSAMLELSGQIQPHENPVKDWVGSWDQPGMRFAGKLKVVTDGGVVHAAGDQLKVSNATSVTLLFTAATSFKTYRDITGDPAVTASRNLELASRHTYEQLRTRHTDDFHKIFSRVRLRLGDTGQESTPTEQRIHKFSKTQDPALVALYYEFGRYLLISSSRPGGQPANLQGIWNTDLTPAWGSKWTTNINLEMNYWPAETGNLWESETPLWDLIRDLRASGADTAKVHYHANGWVLHHNTDLWRAATPVDSFWGVWPTAGAWLTNQMWDHYEFSQDRTFLRNEAYPAMREAAQFFLETLTPIPSGKPMLGKLVKNPSTSPETLLQPKVSGNPVVVLVPLAVTFSPVVELAGSHVASGRGPLASTQSHRTVSKPAPSPADAAAEWRLSLLACRACVASCCVRSVI